MNVDRERQIEAHFQALADLPPPERERALKERCADDPEVRERVIRLLKHHDDAHDPGLRTPIPFRVDGPKPAPTLLPEHIGPYKVLQLLGEGGMGIVYLAEQTQPIHRRVALKVIKLGMDTQAVISRFEAEREALALMNHPNVARVIDAGTTELGRPYFVMEYVEGVPITQFCDQERLPLASRLKLFMQVCLAVQHAHQKGIIHRDLKPSNVLVTPPLSPPLAKGGIGGVGEVKVIDFGIAKATQQKLTEQTFATEQGILVGTPAYMSPEQADPLSQDIDTRADVYALGVILYELLVGTLPFEPAMLRHAALSEIQRIIREVDAPKPSSRVGFALRTSTGSGDLDGPATPTQLIAHRRDTDAKSLYRQIRGDLDWIVMKCLEKDRSRRYDTANALVLEIQRYLNHEPVTAGPPSRAYRVRKFVRRNRVAVTTTALIFLSLAGGLVGTSMMFARARAAEARERAERIRAEEGESIAEESRVRANEALDDAEQVTQFLSDMLASADPGKQGKDVTVREVLDKAAAGIEEQFGDKPLIEARLRLTLGKTYRALGLYDRAEPEAAEAAALYTLRLGSTNPLALKAVNEHTILIQERGGFDQAEATLRSTLEIQRRTGGEEHADTLATMNNLAISLWRQGRFQEAEELHRKVWETRKRVLGDEHPSTLVPMGNLAMTLVSQGRYAEAEELNRQVLAGRTRALGVEHPNTLSCMNDLASSLSGQGRYLEAEELHRSAYEVQRRVLGEDHASTLATLNSLAYSLLKQGRYGEAEEYGKGVVDGIGRTLGEEHPRVLGPMHVLAVIVMEQGHYTEADELFQKAIALAKRIRGEQHPDTLSSMNSLAVSLTNQGRYAAAEEMFRELVGRFRDVLGAEDWRTLNSMKSLGQCLYEQGRFAEAEETYRETLGIERRILGANNPRLPETLDGLAAVLAKLEKWAEAETLCREAGSVRGSRQPAEHRARMISSNLLGSIICGLGRYSEAEPLLVESYNALQVDPGVPARHKKEMVDRLVRLYDSWNTAEPGKGYDAKAAEWRTLPKQPQEQDQEPD